MAEVRSRLPAIPGLSNFESIVLQLSADGVAMRFCSPVYLIGSSLEHGKPLDIDIVIVVTKMQFFHLVGVFEKEYHESLTKNEVTEARLRMARLTKKYRESFEGVNLDVDLKFQTHEKFFSHNGERLRLDQFKTVFCEGE